MSLMSFYRVSTVREAENLVCESVVRLLFHWDSLLLSKDGPFLLAWLFNDDFLLGLFTTCCQLEPLVSIFGWPVPEAFLGDMMEGSCTEM
jgi:hypothetical protein